MATKSEKLQSVYLTQPHVDAVQMLIIRLLLDKEEACHLMDSGDVTADCSTLAF